MTNNAIRDHEYDNYPIPPYNPNLSPEERARLAAEAHAKLENIIREVEKKYSD